MLRCTLIGIALLRSDRGLSVVPAHGDGDREEGELAYLEEAA